MGGGEGEKERGYEGEEERKRGKERVGKRKGEGKKGMGGGDEVSSRGKRKKEGGE